MALKDKYFRRQAAGAVLGIDVADKPWSVLMPQIYIEGDELTIARFKAVKARLKRFKTGAAVAEAAQSPQMREFIKSVTEAPEKPAPEGEAETVVPETPKRKSKKQTTGASVAAALAAAMRRQKS